MSNAVPNPNQESMFVHNEQTGAIHPRADMLLPEVADQGLGNRLHDPNPGPAVNILERNAHMQNMLRRFGVMSRTTGLAQISETGQRRKLEDRYDDVDRVVGSAIANQSEKDLEAKREYAAAFGLNAIIASGLMGEEDAKAMARDSFKNEVIPVFADAKGAKKRDAMKTWMNYQERKLTGKRTVRPKVALPKPPKIV
jgi:hypothetical protein